MHTLESNPSELGSITCHDLFSMAALPHLKLLAGARNLSNIITRVNIMEVPDIQNWAQKHEFLITTGYSYQNNLDEFLNLIPKLVEKGVSAFAIKPRRFIEKIPQSVIDCAEKYGLPLFELADDTIFSNVVREVMEKVVSSEMSAILQLQDRLSQVSSLMLRGTNSIEILEELSRIIRNPIAIIAPAGQLIASEANYPLFEEVYEQLMVKDFHQEETHFHSTVTLKSKDDKYYTAQRFSLRAEKDETIVAIVIEDRSPCTALDISSIKHILPYLNIRIQSEAVNEQVKNKYLDNFLQDWLNGHIKSEEELDAKGKVFQLSQLSEFHYRVGIIHFASDLYVHPDFSALSLLNGQKEHGFLFTVKDNQLIVIIADSREEGIGEEKQAALRRMIEKVCHTTHFAICLGESYKALALNEAIEDAERLYTAAKASAHSVKSELITWDKLGIYAVLTLLPAHKNVERFLEKYIHPIMAYDEQHHSNLLQTLQAYFQMGCNIRSTAQQMYTHYNTVVYRLDKIKTILNVTFDDPEIQFKLLLALKLYEMNQPIK